jgi:threonine/homoserine/homoserine lactone efflux protein
MELAVAVLSVAGAITLGAMSPGPSFVMVARTALSVSRRDGIAAALGMGVGGALFALAALLGLHLVLASVPALYAAVKLFGGGYLIYLGCRIWGNAGVPLAAVESEPAERPGAWWRSLFLGLGTQLSNPKTAIVYASVFIALLPREAPLWVVVTLPLTVFCIEAGWYSVVALALSARAPRALYRRSKRWIDRTAGGVMLLLGVKLLADTRHT